mmetsp:Transcript_52538/g.153079  ORF Transcript_52538/g.153079 Transcript_52538/m.153079 type:complete len:308 (+) Transcript_52538:1273-2196(+)
MAQRAEDVAVEALGRQADGGPKPKQCWLQHIAPKQLCAASQAVQRGFDGTQARPAGRRHGAADRQHHPIEEGARGGGQAPSNGSGRAPDTAASGDKELPDGNEDIAVDAVAQEAATVPRVPAAGTNNLPGRLEHIGHEGLGRQTSATPASLPRGAHAAVSSVYATACGTPAGSKDVGHERLGCGSGASPQSLRHNAARAVHRADAGAGSAANWEDEVGGKGVADGIRSSGAGFKEEANGVTSEAQRKGACVAERAQDVHVGEDDRPQGADQGEPHTGPQNVGVGRIGDVEGDRCRGHSDGHSNNLGG